MENQFPDEAPSIFLDFQSDWKDALNSPPKEKREPSTAMGPIQGYFDGASRGNPGEAGAGALLLDGGGVTLWECARPLGKRTNNEAEYMALILLLEEVERRNIEAHIYGDSRLVVKQVTGQWKINEPRLRDLAKRARELLDRTKSSLEWIPREENASADRLSNIALDGPKEPSEGKGAGQLQFDPEKLEKVKDFIFIAHGTEDYAVDLLHKACTCPAFQRYRRCKHLDSAMARYGK